MGERFFSPRSLSRVANAVEWEEELRFWKDGTSNQSRYMEALAILWERWMRQWALPDLAQTLKDVGGKEFATLFVRIIETIPPRIEQFKGFAEGLWVGANPRGSGRPASRGTAVGTSGVPEADVQNALDGMFVRLRKILSG